jgi:hypothetical protein
MSNVRSGLLALAEAQARLPQEPVRIREDQGTFGVVTHAK